MCVVEALVCLVGGWRLRSSQQAAQATRVEEREAGWVGDPRSQKLNYCSFRIQHIWEFLKLGHLLEAGWETHNLINQLLLNFSEGIVQIFFFKRTHLWEFLLLETNDLKNATILPSFISSWTFHVLKNTLFQILLLLAIEHKPNAWKFYRYPL